MAILTLDDVCFSYDRTPVLQNLSFQFEEGHMYCIMGRSGAGKTTLLSLLSALAQPNSGTICYNGEDISRINRYTFRSKYIGVIFQSFNLITKFTALENVILSMDIAGLRVKDKKQQALNLLESVGLDEAEANRRVLKLSGGQQQRVAIARALSYDPDIILADEPTGNLDSETQDEIMAIFRELADRGKCVILVSHSPQVAEQCDITYELKRVVSKKPATKKVIPPKPVITRAPVEKPPVEEDFGDSTIFRRRD